MKVLYQKYVQFVQFVQLNIPTKICKKNHELRLHQFVELIMNLEIIEEETVLVLYLYIKFTFSLIKLYILSSEKQRLGVFSFFFL